ncbi:unnamed protein product [Cunninghamella blakesleeana]
MTETIRGKSTDLLKNALDDNEQLAKEIEQAIYDAHSKVDKDYKESIRSHVFNLKDTSNPYLKSKVMQGTIPPKEFAEMDADAMASLDRRQSNEILRRNSLLDSLNMQHATPRYRDLDDPDAYH